MAETKAELPLLFFETPEAWEQWLQTHPDSPGIWLQFAKKGSGTQSLDYPRALEVALCYGWIDSLPRKIDDTYYGQKFTPRRARSVWSQRNREIVARLIAQGRMQPAGQTQIEKARADGRWDNAYAGQANFEMPQDFLDALQPNPEAQTFYKALNRLNRFAIYYRLNNAKRAGTRARRIEKFVAQLARGEKIV